MDEEPDRELAAELHTSTGMALNKWRVIDSLICDLVLKESVVKRYDCTHTTKFCLFNYVVIAYTTRYVPRYAYLRSHSGSGAVWDDNADRSKVLTE